VILKKISEKTISFETLPTVVLFLLLGILLEIFLPTEFSLGKTIIHWLPFAVLNLSLASILTYNYFFVVTLFAGAFQILYRFGLNSRTLLITFLYLAFSLVWYFLLQKIFTSRFSERIKVLLLFILVVVTFILIHILFHATTAKLEIDFEEAFLSGVFNSAPLFFLVFWLIQMKSSQTEYSAYFRPFLYVFLIMLVLTSLVLFALSQLHYKFVFHTFEKNFISSIEKIAVERARDYGFLAEENFNDLLSQLRRTSNFPGVQWRSAYYFPVINQRLQEIYGQFASRGIENVVIVSEEGKVEFAAGATVTAGIKQVYEECLWFFSTRGAKGVQPQLIFKEDRLYICFPLYRTSFSPVDRKRPDNQRNGFLIARLDLDVFLRSVQIKFYDQDDLHCFVYFQERKPRLLSFSFDISKEKKEVLVKQAAVNELALQAREKNSAVVRFVGKRYVTAGVPVKLGNLRVYSVFSIDYMKVSSQIRIAQREITNRNIVNFLMVGVIFVGSYFVASFFFRRLEEALREKGRQLEREIKSKFELLEAVVQNLPLGFVLCDVEGNVRLINTFGKIFFERDAGGSVSKITETSFGAAFLKCQESTGIARIEIISKNRIIGVSCSRFKYGEDTLFALLLSDITEIRAAQQAAIVESRNLLIGEIAKSLKEFLVKPMQVAMAKVSTLKVKKDIPEENKQLLEEIELVLEEMAEVLSTFTALEVGALHQETVNLNLREAIDSALKILQPLIKRHEIEVHLKNDHDIFIKGNWTRLQLALLTIFNFVSEVLKDLPENREMIIDLKQEADTVELRVAYNGHLPSEELKKEIEKPFYTDSITKIGASLFLAREMVEKDGGIMRVEVNENGLPAFVLELPR
jgi:PAS domain-containing protein